MGDRMTLTEAFKALAGYGPAVWCGVAAAIVTFVIEIILCTKGILFAGTEKKIALAKQRGHVLKATRRTLRYRDREPENTTANRIYRATYEYTVNGTIHTKALTSTGMKLPTTISLYYVNNPSKVFSEYDAGKNPLKILLFVVPVLVAYVVMTALGFQP